MKFKKYFDVFSSFLIKFCKFFNKFILIYSNQYHLFYNLFNKNKPSKLKIIK